MKYQALFLAAALQMPLYPALAQQAADYPTGPVRLIVPSPPGGGTDVTARLLANALSGVWGQPVVVDNHAGGTGTVGTNSVAQAAPDGRTLGIVIATHATNPLLYDDLPYSHDDFELVTLVAEYPYIVAINPSLPVETFEEFIDYARDNPGEIAFASSGIGSGPHLGVELLMQQTDTDFLHIPYTGAGPATVDLVSGEVQMMFSNFLAAMPMINEGRLRILAVTSADRSDVMPDVPAISETLPGFSVTSWYAIIAPAGTPAEIVSKIQTDIAAALEQPELRERLEEEGVVPVGSTPEEFAAFIEEETAKWQEVIDLAGVVLE